jgi:phosphate/phosphite/phosphonate ABC transporter binding protein
MIQVSYGDGDSPLVDRRRIRMTRTIPDFITFGYAEPEARSKTRDRMAELATRLGALAEIDVGITQLPSYDRVAQLIHHGDIDLAWLSPIPLVSLARNRRVAPLVALVRDNLMHFRCAFVVAASSRISSLKSLRGKRAAWVDAHSASGFVLPRVELEARGVALWSLGAQQFYGSHEGVVRAVASGRADFGATWARIQGDKVVGPWTRTPGMSSSIRVLATFGEVPPDAIAARFDLDRGLRDRLVHALLAMTKDADDRKILSDVFGAERLEVPQRSLYEPMREIVIDAYERGLLKVDAATDEEMLGAAATIERRIDRDGPPTVPRVTPPPTRSGARRRSDETQEEVISLSNPKRSGRTPVGSR